MRRIILGEQIKVKGYDGKEVVRELARVKLNINVVQKVALRSKKELGRSGLLAVEHCELNTLLDKVIRRDSADINQVETRAQARERNSKERVERESWKWTYQ